MAVPSYLRDTPGTREELAGLQGAVRHVDEQFGRWTQAIRKTDYESLVEIQERLKQRHCLPQKQYADSGYMSGPNRATSAQNGIDFIGPTVPVVSKQSKIPNGITTDQFDIDIENLQATCPDGFSVGPDSTVAVEKDVFRLWHVETGCGHLVTPATENAIYKRCFVDPLQISKELPGG